MNSLQSGSYLSINIKPKNLLPLFCQHFGFKLIQENNRSMEQISLHRLWKRKSLFSGEIPGLYFEISNVTVFYEKTPSTLYHATHAILNLSKEIETPLYHYFYDPSSKSCGLKIYENGNLKKHIESEIDYKIETNSGGALEFELDLFKTNPLFDQENLCRFLENLQLPLISSLQDPSIKPILCHFTR